MRETGYQRLTVWKKSHELVLNIYTLTHKFPKEELYGLTNQIRRAVISVPANIVEGQTRQSLKDFLHFLSIANGSLVEVEYYLLLIKDLRYITNKEYQEISSKREEVGKLLYGFIHSIQQQQ